MVQNASSWRNATSMGQQGILQVDGAESLVGRMQKAEGDETREDEARHARGRHGVW